MLLQALLEVCEEAAVCQVLGHYINRPLFGAHAIELDQVLMAKLPCLSKKKKELKHCELGFLKDIIGTTIPNMTDQFYESCAQTDSS